MKFSKNGCKVCTHNDSGWCNYLILNGHRLNWTELGVEECEHHNSIANTIVVDISKLDPADIARLKKENVRMGKRGRTLFNDASRESDRLRILNKT